MVSETYNWGSWQNLSRWQIQNMKKNMKKVPIIQEKSKKQHQKDEIDAEISFLENLNKLQDITWNRNWNNNNEGNWKEKSRRKKLLYKVKKIFKS